MNILSDEWIIANEKNCPLLGGVATFDFNTALRYIKRGIKVTRPKYKSCYFCFVDEHDYGYDDEIFSLEDIEATDWMFDE